MSLSLEVVQSLAPDQSALSSAGKLLATKHWVRVAQDRAAGTIWGECQGSGSNPYLVVADVQDHGYKCSCPSRKFPCKHSLALMWRYAERPQEFAEDTPPQWVQEWLGRRKRGAKTPTAAAPDAPAKDIADARATQENAAPSAEELEKKAKAGERRRAQTEATVRAGLDELRQWLRDQLRGGLAAFVEDAPAHCRRIAARLVDAKAAALASRIDELPSRLLTLPKQARAEAAAFELGQCALLVAAWERAPDDADARAALLQSPTREDVLAASDVLRVAAQWEVAGTRIATRRDGLVSQATWLIDAAYNDGVTAAVDPTRSCGFALLLDFFPATAGRRQSAFVPGQRFAAELVYYPGRHPLRAVLQRSLDLAPTRPPPLPGSASAATDEDASRNVLDPLAAHRRHLSAVPWAQITPLRLGPGSLTRDGHGRLWWNAQTAAADATPIALPIAPLADEALWLGAALTGAIALWNGFQADLLRLDTPLGAAWPDD